MYWRIQCWNNRKDYGILRNDLSPSLKLKNCLMNKDSTLHIIIPLSLSLATLLGEGGSSLASELEFLVCVGTLVESIETEGEGNWKVN